MTSQSNFPQITREVITRRQGIHSTQPSLPSGTRAQTRQDWFMAQARGSVSQVNQPHPTTRRGHDHKGLKDVPMIGLL